MEKIKLLIRLLRPKEWIKNLFIFAPLIFAMQFTVPSQIGLAILAFCLFCIAASSVYIVNDILDKNADQLHRTKRYKRPLASGQITTRQALYLLIFLYVLLSFALVFFPHITHYILIYILLNFLLLSSPKLKMPP